MSSNPCVVAISSDNVETLAALVAAGADRQAKDVNDRTLLHRVVAIGAWNSLHYILTKKTSYKLGAEDITGESIMSSIFRNGPPLITEFFLHTELRADACCHCESNILTATTDNMSFLPKMLKVLLRRLPDGLLPTLLTHRALRGGTPLYAACTIASPKSRNEKINMSLDAGADLEQGGGDFGTPLMGASATGRLSVVKLLVSKGATVCYVKDRKMYSAFRASRNFPEIREWLLVGRYIEGPRLLMDGGSMGQ